MSRRRFLVAAALLIFSAFSGLVHITGVHAAETLPERLSDQQFWKLSTESSEPDGTFRSDNLLSNELWFQYVIPELVRTAGAGRVYMGVGPEQNFTYITALKPKMAIIVDIRRGNLDLHLMYKALFELSSDRAEFASRLFSRPRPAGLDSKSVKDIFAAYDNVLPSETLYAQNLQAIRDQLLTKHALPLSSGDLQGIQYVYRAFYQFGPNLRYSSTGGFGGGNQPSYAALMMANDGKGQERSYLASDEDFAFMKDLESRNMLVPVVGNFGGPKAIRAVGQYLKASGATVSAFYLSNVEQYLRQDDLWMSFCGNVATLPLDETSTFIRSVRGGQYGPPIGTGLGLNSELGNILNDVKACDPAGHTVPAR